MEAVEEMKKGNKVKRTSNAHNDIYAFNGIFYMNKSFRQFEMGDFEATDWEVLEEDKEWNLLAQRKVYQQDLEYWSEHSIKKCQDLIIKDIKELNNTPNWVPLALEIIKERFGDL